MKVILLFITTATLAARLITSGGATANQYHHAIERSLKDLRANMFQAVQDRIQRFNNSRHGHKREITFDPEALGCMIRGRNRLYCSRAVVSNHFQSGKPLSAGVVIIPYEES